MPAKSDNFEFAAAPKTGTKWVQAMFRACNVPFNRSGLHHVQWSPDCSIRATVVRHPLDWVRSYFVRMMGRSVGHKTLDRLQECGRQHSFHDWCEQYLERMPGQVSRMFASYTDGATLIGRTEDLPGFINELGAIAGFDVDQDVIDNAPPEDHTGLLRRVRWRPDLYKAMREAESQAIEAYGYAEVTV